MWSSVGPLYSSEIACKEYKGVSGVLYSMHFGLGIITVFLVSIGLDSSEGYWRVILGMPIVLSLIMLTNFLTIFKDETAPFLLLKMRDEEKARAVLNRFFIEEIVEDEINSLKAVARSQKEEVVGWLEFFFSKRFRLRIIISIVLTAGLSFNGCNVLHFFSADLLKDIGNSEYQANLFTAIMPIGDIVGSIVAFFLIERIGRK